MKKFLLLCISIAAFALVGCESVGRFFNDNQSAYDASVRIAATRVINNDADRADRFEQAAQLVKAWAEEDSPVGLIDSRLREQIDWSGYEPDEQILIDEFLRYLKAEIESRVEAGEMEANHKVLISHTADLVLQVTARY